MLGSLIAGLNPVAQGVLALSLAAVVGLALGAVKVRGIGLGVGGVLFAGLVLGHLGLRGDPHVLEFLKEFGLILFVYTIGVQVGPGFFSALKRVGLPLNLMAAAIVGLGVLTTVAVFFVAGLPLPVVLGLFSGAVTNTPSLAAGQQMLAQMGATKETLTLLPTGYAVAYPFGIAGILLAMTVIRMLFRVSPAAEGEAFEAGQQARRHGLETLNVRLTNPNLDGLPLSEIPGLHDHGVVVSRVLRQEADGHIEVPHPETRFRCGDVLFLVGTPQALHAMQLILGETADINLKERTEEVKWDRLVVTNTKILGKSVDDLNLLQQCDVVISRVSRSGIELLPSPQLHLQFGDIVQVIGTEEHIRAAAKLLGNTGKALQQAQILPIFAGIALGVLIGAIPIALPGLPAPVSLGLAGGPLLAALLLSRLGHMGPLVWFMPPSANHALREVGIVLFLAVVGLNAGDRFFDVLMHGDGVAWMGWAALITVVPLLVVGLAARLIWKQNYLTLCGVLAGSMTDPPALAFAAAQSSSEAASVAYATVYPLVMCLRILAPQILVLLLWGL